MKRGLKGGRFNNYKRARSSKKSVIFWKAKRKERLRFPVELSTRSLPKLVSQCLRIIRMLN